MHHIFFIHSFINGYLGCSHVLAIVNSAAINTGVHVSFSIMVFSGYMPSSGKRLLVFNGAQNKRRLCNKSRLLCKLLYHLCRLIQWIQWCLKCQWQIGIQIGAFGRLLGSLGWEDPLRRKGQPTPVFLLGKSHGQGSLVGCSPWGHKSQT